MLDTKTRIRSKLAGLWRCGICQTRMTQLSREHGRWPTESFKGLSAEAKQKFYEQAKDLKNCKALKTFSDGFLQKYEKHEEYYSEGGAFLPLSVWARKGWDADSIERMTLPNDIRPCRIANLVYRVPIFRAGKQGVKGSEQNDKAAFASSTKKRKAETQPAAEPAASEESDSSESSSSSPSEKKNKSKRNKKQKEGAKQKKEKEKERAKSQKEKNEKKQKEKDQKRAEKEEARVAKIAERAAHKADEAGGKLAAQIANTVAQLKADVTAAVGHVGFHDLGEQVKKTARDLQKTVETADADVRRIQGGDLRFGIEGITSQKDWKAFACDAKRKLANLNALYQVSARFG